MYIRLGGFDVFVQVWEEIHHELCGFQSYLVSLDTGGKKGK